MDHHIEKPKILLVDDNENVLDLFLALPEWEAFDAVPVNSAQTALRLLDRESFELVISDVQMPGMDGIELFREIEKRHPGIPVIRITAFGSVGDALAAVKLGAFHFDAGHLYRSVWPQPGRWAERGIRILY